MIDQASCHPTPERPRYLSRCARRAAASLLFFAVLVITLAAAYFGRVSVHGVLAAAATFALIVTLVSAFVPVDRHCHAQLACITSGLAVMRLSPLGARKSFAAG